MEQPSAVGLNEQNLHRSVEACFKSGGVGGESGKGWGDK